MWPQHVLDRFLSVPNNPRERDFHGPYNKLLYWVFPADSRFTVDPQSYPIHESHDTVDFIVEYTVLYDNIPVFILEIKDPSTLKYISSRHKADRQIRYRITDLYPLCRMPVLYGVSAYGTIISIYSQHDNVITPEYIPRDVDSVVDTAPITRWNINILSDEGYDRMMNIFNYIKEQTAQLV